MTKILTRSRLVGNRVHGEIWPFLSNVAYLSFISTTDLQWNLKGIDQGLNIFMYFYSHSLKVTELLCSLTVDGSILQTHKRFYFVNKHLAAALLPVYYNSCCATPVMFVLILSAAEAVWMKLDTHSICCWYYCWLCESASSQSTRFWAQRGWDFTHRLREDGFISLGGFRANTADDLRGRSEHITL